MIICGVMITSGPRLRLEQHPHDADRRAEHRDGDAGADHGVDAVFRRPAPGGEIPRHVGERDDDEPDAVFGRGALHDGDDDMRRAADEGEEHRRIERRDQRVAEEGAVARAGCPSAARKCAKPSPVATLRVSGSWNDAQASTAAANSANEGEDRLPAERGVEHAADQRCDHRRDHHRHGDPADHRGGAVAVVEVADDRAADHDADGRAERLQQCAPRSVPVIEVAASAAKLATTVSARPASITGRRPKRSDSVPSTSCETAMPSRNSESVSCTVPAPAPSVVDQARASRARGC